MGRAVPADDLPGGSSPFEAALQAEGISGPVADIARSIYQQESGSGRNTKTSNAGAVGGMQIIPATFNRMADKGWAIDNPEQNARAGIRYINTLHEKSGGDPALTAAGYYGGEGGMEKARRGIAVSDPRNPNAPNTLQYGQQVAARLPKTESRAVPADDLPDASPAAVAPVAKQKAPEKTLNQSFLEGARDLTAGAVRGAGSIGATLLTPYDLIAGNTQSISNPERRAGMDAGLKSLGANTDSLSFKGGKLVGEIAGTAGAGGVLAKPVQALAASRYATGAEPVLNGIATSLQTGGFRTGEMAGAGVGNALTRILGGASVGGASAGLVDPSTAGTGTIIGGALPGATQLAGQAGAGIRTAMSGQVAPEVAALAKRAKELGISIPADRLLNSKPLDAVASGLRYTPFSGRAGSEAAMEGQLDRAVSRTFGQNSENVTQALRKAGDDLGAKFETTLTQNGVSFDKKLLEDVSSVYNKAENELGSDALKPIKSAIDTMIAKGESGVIEGQAAYNIKKDLDRIGRGSGNEAHHALELKGVLMDALNRSLGTEKAAAFATTRQQYGNMLALEKLARNGAEGGISAARLSNMKNINNPELQELADIAAQFVKQRESQHGGAQRAAAGAVATYFGGPVVAAGGAVAGRVGNMALNSNKLRDLLLNQAPNTSVENGLGLLTQGAYRAAPLLPAQ